MAVLYMEILNPSLGKEGCLRSVIFAETGGTIGGDPNANWTIQDRAGGVPDHCGDIIHDGTGYVLRALAPVIHVNGTRNPLRADRCVVLSDQDRLALGQLEIAIKIGPRAYVEDRLLPLETLVVESSDVLAALINDEVGSGGLSSGDPEAFDPMVLLARDGPLQSNLDPMANFASGARAHATDDLMKIIDANGVRAKLATTDLGQGRFDPVSTPALRSEKFGFEELVAPERNPGLAEHFAPNVIEAEVAKEIDPGSDEFMKRCWQRFTEKYHAKMEDGT